MQEITKICERAEDMVAYLYGEAARSEAKDFERHLQHCASCSAELAAFGHVREAINDWRQQSLGALSFEGNVAAPIVETPARRRSALAALREFFTLSPAWMRASVAAVALIFFALSFIAVAYFTEKPDVLVIERTNGENSIVAETNVQPKEQPAGQQNITLSVKDETHTTVKSRRRGTGSSQKLVVKRRQPRQRNLAEPSTEIVRADEYLPFTAPSSEESLPSLADLANDDN